MLQLNVLMIRLSLHSSHKSRLFCFKKNVLKSIKFSREQAFNATWFLERQQRQRRSSDEQFTTRGANEKKEHISKRLEQN